MGSDAPSPPPSEDVEAGGLSREDAAVAVRGWRAFLTLRMVLAVWVPIAIIGALHYGTSAEHTWVHNVLRRVYYLPIIIAAFQLGLRGGLLAAAVVSVSYLPHAFGHVGQHVGHVGHTDPAPGLEKALEIALYHVVGAVAGYLSDAERRRRAELRRSLDEQRTLQTQLVRAGRLSALGEVVAGIAHEVKNPLHALRGTAEIVDPLIDASAPERRMWEIHLTEIERLDRVAERFLSFARPRPVELQPLDLREVAERLVELVGADARKRGVAVAAALPDEPVTVRGDRDQLAQLALNIALNAIHAIGEGGGSIRVAVLADHEHEGQRRHALRIENDGPPIPADELEHLFDPFHGTDEEGTGLGLSISERIAEQHDGTIEAANDGELGVSFTVLLPPE